MSWKCSGAAVPGLGHDRNDYASCQDYVYFIQKKNFACISLSDGAGSAIKARDGARIISERVAKYLECHFYSLYRMSKVKIASTITNLIQKAISDVKEEEEKLNDYNATLLVVAVKDNRAIALHVGDGIIGCGKKDKLSVLSHPWNGEFKNETVFATSRYAARYMDVIKLDNNPYDSFFVMSDGSQTSFYSERDASLISVRGLIQFIEFFKQADVAEMKSFIDYNLFNLISKKTHDDCSMCFMIMDRK